MSRNFGLRASGHEPLLQQILVRAVGTRADRVHGALTLTIDERVGKWEQPVVLLALPQELSDKVCMFDVFRPAGEMCEVAVLHLAARHLGQDSDTAQPPCVALTSLRINTEWRNTEGIVEDRYQGTSKVIGT